MTNPSPTPPASPSASRVAALSLAVLLAGVLWHGSERQRVLEEENRGLAADVDHLHQSFREALRGLHAAAPPPPVTEGSDAKPPSPADGAAPAPPVVVAEAPAGPKAEPEPEPGLLTGDSELRRILEEHARAIRVPRPPGHAVSPARPPAGGDGAGRSVPAHPGGPAAGTSPLPPPPAPVPAAVSSPGPVGRVFERKRREDGEEVLVVALDRADDPRIRPGTSLRISRRGIPIGRLRVEAVPPDTWPGFLRGYEIREPSVRRYPAKEEDLVEIEAVGRPPAPGPVEPPAPDRTEGPAPEIRRPESPVVEPAALELPPPPKPGPSGKVDSFDSPIRTCGVLLGRKGGITNGDRFEIRREGKVIAKGEATVVLDDKCFLFLDDIDPLKLPQAGDVAVRLPSSP